MHHVSVAQEHRGRGIGTALTERCLGALAALGISKVHLDVLETNESAKRFWANRDRQLRRDIARFSIVIFGGENA